MASRTMKWDSDANEKLLLIILATHDIKIDFPGVATSFGPHCTPRAVQEQLKKLKKNAKIESVSTGEDTPDKKPTPPKKATAPKKATTPKKTATAKKRKTNGGGAAPLSPLSEHGNDFGSEATPTKKTKPKGAAKRKAAEMLAEDDDGDAHTVVKKEASEQEESIPAIDRADAPLTPEHNPSLTTA